MPNYESINDGRAVLREAILETARWRREKATEFADDYRNADAVELLEKCAASVDDVPDQLIRDYQDAWKYDEGGRVGEAQSIVLRNVGFQTNTDSATKLLEIFADHTLDVISDSAAV